MTCGRYDFDDPNVTFVFLGDTLTCQDVINLKNNGCAKRVEQNISRKWCPTRSRLMLMPRLTVAVVIPFRCLSAYIVTQPEPLDSHTEQINTDPPPPPLHLSAVVL